MLTAGQLTGAHWRPRPRPSGGSGGRGGPGPVGQGRHRRLPREGVQVRDLAKRHFVILRQRIVLIRSMQRWGVISFLLCTLSMFCLFMQWDLAGQWCFGASLASLVLSLTVSLYEIQISCNAINIELESLENR